MTLSRRTFLTRAVGAAGLTVASGLLNAEEAPKIAGFEETKTDVDDASVWKPKSDRKIRLGIAGFGVCKFGTQFGLQNHPNAEVVGVADLFPERCDGLAKECRCDKQFACAEEMFEDDSIEAVFIATDAPSHADLAIKALRAGKHVATAVPAVFGNLEDADRLFEAVKETGLTYAMFETTAFRDSAYASRQLYEAGVFGRMLYSEGEYYHDGCHLIDSYRGWRIGLPPQWYPTHSNGYYTTVTHGSFTEVSCFGPKTVYDVYEPSNNRYGNRFGTEIALFKTSEGGTARMAVSWESPGEGGETGRNRGLFGTLNYDGVFHPRDEEIDQKAKAVNIVKPALPPGMGAGGHGGSHGYLGNDFIESILENRKPLVDVACALNTTVAGVVAHQSAMRDGELMKIPQYKYPF